MIAFLSKITNPESIFFTFDIYVTIIFKALTLLEGKPVKE